MKDYTEIKEEITELIKVGNKMYEALLPEKEGTKVPTDFSYFFNHYDTWYTTGLHLVNQILPERANDFKSYYKNEKRKEIKYSTYTISDALKGVTSPVGHYGPSSASICVLNQTQIIKSCSEKFESKIFNIQEILQADIFDSELEAADHLNKKGFSRAAGAVAGVVLEKHLAKVCVNRGITFGRKTITIAMCNDALKDQAYDIVEWRRIQRLGDIRNLCDHDNGRVPTKEEVDELIHGVERVIKTIF